MKDLNSVLIEGKLTTYPREGYTAKGFHYSEAILETNNGEYFNYITVRVRENLIETFNTLKEGSKVRLIGALAQDDKSRVILLIENLEIKEL